MLLVIVWNFMGETEEDESSDSFWIGCSGNHVNAGKMWPWITGGCIIGALVFTTKIKNKAKQI